MLDNIQITNKNGDAMMVEPICYLLVKSANKKYLLYTLNEKVDNDLTKIYVANVADGGDAQPIEQGEWDNLRKAMSKMSKREIVEDVEYFNMNGVNFVVGEAKKLGIPILLKQVFKDEAAAKTIASIQDNSATGGAMFIDPNLVAEPVKTPVEDTSAQSIFVNPPKPTIENTPVAVDNVAPSQPIPVVEQQIVVPQVETVSTPLTQVPTPIDNTNDALQTQVVSSQLEIPAVEQPAFVPQVEPVIAPPIEQVSQPQMLEPVTQNISNDVSNLITDDEALQAIDLLQKYIEQESKE